MVTAKEKNDDDDSHQQMSKLMKRMRNLKVGLSIADVAILLLTLTHIFHSWYTVTSISARVQNVEDDCHMYISKQRMMNEKISLLSQEQKSYVKQMIEAQNIVSEKFTRFENEIMTAVKHIKQKKRPTHSQVAYRTVRNETVEGKQFAKEKSYFLFEKNKNPMMSAGEIQLIPFPEMLTKEYDEFIKKNNDETKKSEKVISSISRRLEVDENSIECVTNLFELNIQLDDYPEETGWELVNVLNRNIIANESYFFEEDYSSTNTSFCLDDGQYMLTIFDAFGDGMCSGFEPDECLPFIISINNEIIIEGRDFDNEVNYRFSITNGMVCVGNLIEIESVIDESPSEGQWSLTNTRTSEVLTEFSLSQNDSVCVGDGVFLFSFSDRDERRSLNKIGVTEFGYFKITVNGKILLEGPLSLKYLFYIAEDDVGKYDCTQNPILDSFNDFSPKIYDERTAEMMSVFRKLSSSDDIQNNDTPQYKAACYILVEDKNELTSQDAVMVERYTLALFLISTRVIISGDEIPFHTCDFPGVICNRDGFIKEINFCEYCMLKI